MAPETRRMSRKRRLMMKSLPHDVIERILERLVVKSLLRFKAVSKQWKSTIESTFFQERQLTHCQQSGSSSSSSVKIATPWKKIYPYVSRTSIDGLVCLYDPLRTGFIVNPTTRWHRVLPLSNFQRLLIHFGVKDYSDLGLILYKLALGKDKLTGTYKPVWLYNSSEFGLKNNTTCEVFDFSINAWRYVTPSAPYRIAGPDPAYMDGLFYYFTDCLETKVVSFDLHTEAFQVISRAPFAKVEPYLMVMCNLDNRLCVSMMKFLLIQEIWSFHLGNKTWEKIYSIDVYQTFIKFYIPTKCAFMPLALLDGQKKKKKLLFYSRTEEVCFFERRATEERRNDSERRLGHCELERRSGGFDDRKVIEDGNGGSFGLEEIKKTV
ncbi:F-box associated domain type 1 [Arabidopsis suecica]|uniref:F-box associated domain type 1 n=1 Tax=Arabidopsis suecica TaxID=45249 RepID=A0A8T2BNK3_ARASU|nr:F-box associated domain type 1 [Arabidopsis suecica]